MKKSESSYKNLYSHNINNSSSLKGQSKPKLSGSSSTIKLNGPQYLSNK